MLLSSTLPRNFYYTRNFLDQSDQSFLQLSQELERKSYEIMMFGKKVLQPRLVAYYADEWVDYAYSQTKLYGQGWHPLLEQIRQAIIHLYPQAKTLNSVLCNLYRDGSDSMGRHADDESELWNDPHIYSVTLWSERVFQIKSKGWKLEDWTKCDLILENNALLMMGSGSQIDYVHSIPKTKKSIWPRINLTFRTIF